MQPGQGDRGQGHCARLPKETEMVAVVNYGGRIQGKMLK
jgi:hypothetical protein